jgi:pimeloyl-ACP methyl ester carboxylesterase
VEQENTQKQTPPRVFRKAKFGLDKFILLDLDRVHYIEEGKGEPVILIPGSYGTYRAWNHLIPFLAGHYRLLELDYDTGFKYTAQEQSDRIAKIVEQLNLGKANLMGGPSSGEIIFDFAARYANLVGKIVSIEGSVIKPENKTTTSGAWYKISLSRKNSINVEEEAKSIKSPVLYLYGTNSDNKGLQQEKNIEFFKNFLPQAWIVALEGAIHDIEMKSPAEVANIILDFLRHKPGVKTG